MITIALPKEFGGKGFITTVSLSLEDGSSDTKYICVEILYRLQ